MEAIIVVVIFTLVAGFALWAARKISEQIKSTKLSEASGENATARSKALIEAAKRRLAANPNDLEAVKTLAEASYFEKDYEASLGSYKKLFDLANGTPSHKLDLYQSRIQYGLAALRLKRYDDAVASFSAAYASKQEFNSELFLGLGECEYYRKNYDRALYFLQPLVKLYPDNIEARKFLGMVYYKKKKFSEAAIILRQVLSYESSDKELIFNLANAYYESGKQENALKLFSHLRFDPEYGPASCLYAGTINSGLGYLDSAVEDFQSGLKHGAIRTELMLELKHRLAAVYTQKREFNKALDLYQQIRTVNPSFKNVALEIKRYTELVSNDTFRAYLQAPMADFVAMCRKMLPFFFPKAKIKVTSVDSDRMGYVDITADIKTPKWEESALFRFYRSESTLGENPIREFYEKIKNTSATRGICITPGLATQQARSFVEARIMDLVDKPDLLKILAKL